jgi:hypothetical protein
MKGLFYLLIQIVVAANARSDFVRSPFAIPDSGTPLPFFATTNLGPSLRYQQVYGGSDFQRNGDVQYLITALSFSAGAVFGPHDVSISNLQIRFSTTQKAPDGLSTIFSQNSGPDAALVFSGPLHVAETGFEWNMQINLQQPFLYNPRSGNLLLDVRNFQTLAPFSVQPPGQWLANSVATFGDTTSMIGAFDVNSATATMVSSEGLSTLFTVTPVPEPGPVVLLGAGLGLWALLGLRRRFLPGRTNSSRSIQHQVNVKSITTFNHITPAGGLINSVLQTSNATAPEVVTKVRADQEDAMVFHLLDF